LDAYFGGAGIGDFAIGISGIGGDGAGPTLTGDGLGEFEIGVSSLAILSLTSVWVYDATDYYSIGTTYFSFDVEGAGFDQGKWAVLSDIPVLNETQLVMAVGVSGSIPNRVDLSILAQGLIPIIPAGVKVLWGVTTVLGAPVFGFDVSNDRIGGFGHGSWGQTPTWVAENLSS
jgi:hypothetical protein